jgi:hypothetical protein
MFVRNIIKMLIKIVKKIHEIFYNETMENLSLLVYNKGR